MADVFISYSSKDGDIANCLCKQLEENGVKCWIAPRDIVPGAEWAAAINTAISTSKVFIIIYSANSAKSTQVPNEIMLASNKGVCIIPFIVHNTKLVDAFEYHLGSRHCIYAEIEKNDYKIHDLLCAIQPVIGRKLVGDTVNNTVINNNSLFQSVGSTISGNSLSIKIKPIAIIAAGLAVLLIAVIAIIIGINLNKKDPASNISGVENNYNANSVENPDINPAKPSPEDIKDICYAPKDKTPYENKSVTVLNNDIEKSFTVLGESYNTGFIMSSHGGGSYIIFDNKENYNKLKFTAARTDNTNRENIKIHVYTDGTEVVSHTVAPDSMPKEFEIDITGVKQIKIVEDDRYFDVFVALMDMCFLKDGADSYDKAFTTDVQGAADVCYAPKDKTPYENKSVTVLNNDIEKSFTVLGDSYNTGFIMSSHGGGSYIIFDNKENYTKLRFTLARTDNTNRESIKIHVYTDGTEVVSHTVEPDSMPKEFEIDITGVKQIKIVEDDRYFDVFVALMDMCFLKDGADSYEKIFSLDAPAAADVCYAPKDKTPYENKSVEVLNNDLEKSFTVLGDSYNTGFKMSSHGGGSYIIFDNKENYTKLRFTLARTDNTNRENIKIHIYTDGTEIVSHTVTPDSMPKEFEIDITGVKQIKIVEDDRYFDVFVALLDMCFLKDGADSYEKIFSLDAPATADVCYAPKDKMPYENKDTEVLNNDLEKSFTILGDSYNTGFIMNSQIGPYIIFDNKENYTKLRFTLARIDNTDRKEIKIHVYTDGTEVVSHTVAGDFVPKEIEIDITGKKQIKISEDKIGEYVKIALKDMCFSK